MAPDEATVLDLTITKRNLLDLCRRVVGRDFGEGDLSSQLGRISIEWSEPLERGVVEVYAEIDLKERFSVGYHLNVDGVYPTAAGRIFYEAEDYRRAVPSDVREKLDAIKMMIQAGLRQRAAEGRPNDFSAPWEISP